MVWTVNSVPGIHSSPRHTMSPTVLGYLRDFSLNSSQRAFTAPVHKGSVHHLAGPPETKSEAAFWLTSWSNWAEEAVKFPEMPRRQLI